jgi:hypothetical protein
MMVLRMAAELLGYRFGKGAGVNSHTREGSRSRPLLKRRAGGKFVDQRRDGPTNCTNGIATLYPWVDNVP